MKVAVVTDNQSVYKSFVELVNKHSLGNVTFSYFCSESSKGIFNDDVRVIDIKDDYRELIEEYELVISCHCKKIFPKELVNSVRCINIHPGLNPFNRGWFPQVFAINNGMPHGATIHEMDDEIDHGDIIAQKEVPIFEADTSKTVYERVLSTEIELLDLNFDRIIKNNYVAEAPISEGNYNSIGDFRDLCEIDMEKVGTFREFYNLVRSLTHPPYSNAYFIDGNGNRIKFGIDIIDVSKITK